MVEPSSDITAAVAMCEQHHDRILKFLKNLSATRSNKNLRLANLLLEKDRKLYHLLWKYISGEKKYIGSKGKLYSSYWRHGHLQFALFPGREDSYQGAVG